MRSRQSALFPLVPSVLVLLSFSLFSYAQQWSGIISSSRAVDWSEAGIPGGIPSVTTQCGSTIAAYTGSASTINNAIQNCASGQYVHLGTGTFTLSSMIDFNAKSHVVLRGDGADKTLIVFTSSGSCYGLGTDVCMRSSDNTYAGGPPSTVFNWTAGYSQGTTTITLSSTSGLAPNQTMLVLDQCNDGKTGSGCSGAATDTGNIFVCDAQNTCSGEIGSNNYRANRSQAQIVQVTAVSGNQVTISPGIYMPNWRSGQSPQAWPITPLIQSGIEDLSMDHTLAGPGAGVILFNTFECWMKGVRSIAPANYHVTLFETLRSVVRDSYFFLIPGAAQKSYGIETVVDGNALIENNILQQIAAPVSVDGSSTGSVFAYNYSIYDYSTLGVMSFGHWLHSAGVGMDLFEGNVGAGFAGDDIHGSHNMITLFRNYYNGWETGQSTQTNAIYVAGFSRYFNIIGNVLGRSGYHNNYQVIAPTSTNKDSSIYVLGFSGGSSPNDSLASSTLMRWGNYDTVNNAARFVNSEVPSGISLYPNSVPSSQALPASFYYSSKPAWWQSQRWPPVGPDVTGGNIANVGGHANMIPAMDCYTNVMGGLPSGTGSVLTFNADTCYGNGTSDPPPAPPTGLSAVVQ